MNIEKIPRLKDYTSIDDIPLNITKLNCSYLKLKKLPDLSRFTQLRTLYCSHNRLTSIDNLPDQLEFIFCSNNRITCINNLPHYLTGLFCNNNRIRYIKELPLFLMRLFCNDNCLTSLPDLPFLFEILMCHNNPLHSIPYMPFGIRSLYCQHVPPIYPDRRLYTINTINTFRENYFTLKYGHKLLFYLIKKRMNKIKYDLLETGAKIMMHPDRILRLINDDGIELEEISNNL